MKQQKDVDAAILVVDDEAPLRNSFQIILQRAGYRQVSTAGSFDEAVQALTGEMFDLLICDIVLEDRLGTELLKRVREMGMGCPVLMITGYPEVGSASEAVRCGAFDYLAKPVDKELLLKTTRHAIQQYRLEQKKREVERSREQYRRSLETIFRSVSDPIVSADHSFRVVSMNPAAEDFFRRICPDDGVLKNLDSLAQHSDFSNLPSQVRQVLASGLEISDHRLEYSDGQGERKFLSICISPFNTNQEQGDGVVLVVREMYPARKAPVAERTRFHRMIGGSSVMQQIYLMIESVAKVETSVLITGASGTGKELVAEALHRESNRSDHPLVSVNCTALPEDLKESELFGHRKGAFTGAEGDRAGRILQADKGTLFLDEIGDITMPMQLRFLRFLQEKTFYPVGGDREVHVDVRVIAATNADLREKVAAGIFREDLYYRLLIIDINLPPLADRVGDVPLLADHFLHRFATIMKKPVTGFSEQVMELLESYDWPGNVRQLEHAVERACVLCGGATISKEHLPGEITSLDMENRPDQGQDIIGVIGAGTFPQIPVHLTPETVGAAESLHRLSLCHPRQQSGRECYTSVLCRT